MEELRARVQRQFLRGLGVKSAEIAIAQGLRTFEQWRDFLDEEEELLRERLKVEAKLFNRHQHVNFQSLRWQILLFLVTDSPCTLEEIQDAFKHVKKASFHRTLEQLISDELVAQKGSKENSQFHVTGAGLMEANYCLHHREQPKN
jgi:predicted HTH transcriptional regulator